MKHKYKVGDKLVFVDNSFDELTIGNVTIELAYELEGLVYEDDYCRELDEKDLYTKPEAVEFITNYINKEE